MAREMAPKPAKKPVKETLTVDQIVRLLCVGVKRNLSASGGGRHERNGTGTAICDAGLAQ